MTIISYAESGDDVSRRVQHALEAQRAQLKPLLVPYLSVIFSLLFVAGACGSEYFSATIGFHAAFPVKSDGSSLASSLMSLRFPIIFGLLAGDVILSALPNRAKELLDRITHSLGIGAILLILFGVGGFMLCATLLSLGGDGDQAFAGHFVGLALGIASSAMFTLSFLSGHAMLGKLFSVLPAISAGRAERARIATGDALVAELETRRSRIEGLRSTIAEMEKPNALRRKAANEAGVIVGMVLSEAHDLVASRKVRGDKPLEPQDFNDVPDVPIDALEQRYADLKPYTADYFFNLLDQKEA